jgi:hypothetical protein
MSSKITTKKPSLQYQDLITYSIAMTVFCIILTLAIEFAAREIFRLT